MYPEYRQSRAGRKFKVVDFEPDSIATRSYQPSRRVSFSSRPGPHLNPLQPPPTLILQPSPFLPWPDPNFCRIVRGSNCSSAACCPTFAIFERRRSLIDKERNHPDQRGKKGQSVILKSNTVRGQNPADPIFSPDSDLLREFARGRRQRRGQQGSSQEESTSSSSGDTLRVRGRHRVSILNNYIGKGLVSPSLGYVAVG